MKFELKTEDKNYSEKLLNALKIIFILALIFVFCDALLKLRVISRHYQINYDCRLLSIEKSASNFKKLSRLSNLKSKQKIWEFCKEFVK